ncbi:glycosyltransferase [Antribacter gilvus]|uniref:glycosyltransferase n=1 Tax=Antribacter gilvus TaxID=2304675 RepID=UPI000F76A73F|nr:glycosyltransferase family 2 protein [Antribacter gilvus]
MNTLSGPLGDDVAAAAQPDDVRVVCVVFNPGDELRAFLDSVHKATTRPLDVVLVNNGGPSTALDEAVASGRARLLEAGGNLGYGGGANRGAAGSRARWLVVANPDLEWEPGSLDALVDAAVRVPAAGAVGPRILNSDGSVYPSARALPSLAVGLGHALLHRVWSGNPWSRRYQQANVADRSEERPVGWLSGACLLLRPEAFAAVGGFDERYFMFFEDVDLGDRIGRAGWLNLYAPSATVTHLQGASWKATPAPMIRAHHASARRYLVDRHDRWYQAPLRWAIVAGLWVREQVEVAAARRGKSSPGGSA